MHTHTEAGTFGETHHHLHVASFWLVPGHYLHWLVLFPKEPKQRGKPPSLPLSHLSFCITLSVSLLPLLSQGQG